MNTPIQLGSSTVPAPKTMPVPQAPKPMPPKNGDKKKDPLTWFWVVIGLLIFFGLIFLVTGNKAGAPEKEGEDVALLGKDGAMDSLGPTPSFLWEFAPAGGNVTTGASQTRVTLSVDGEVQEIGTFDGSCLVINGSSWALVENELTGFICWFGGAGNEVGVFFEQGTYLVKQGVVEAGTSGESGVRGNYEVLFTL